MRIFLIISALLAVVLTYLSFNSRGIAPWEMTERFSERRAVFQDWLAACRPGGGCVLTTADAESGADAYVLRLESPSAEIPAELVLMAKARLVAATSPVLAQVDARPAVSFAPLTDDGWLRRPEDPSNAYRLNGARVEEALLPGMRAGGRLTLRFWDRTYTDAAERDTVTPHAAAFSLLGLSAALDWMGANRLR